MGSSNHCCHATPSTPKKPDFLLWGSAIGVLVLIVLAQFFSSQIAPVGWLSVMAHTAVEMLVSMWWGVMVGAVFIGFLAKVPREFIMSILGKGGTVSGLFRATAAGVLLDLCSHGILMVATKLYERGASIGQVMAFLLASPWNSFSLTLILIALVGLKWTVAFIGLSLIVAWITGWVFDWFVAQGWLPKNPNVEILPADFRFWPEANRRFKSITWNSVFFKEVVTHSIRDSRMVVRWLLFGILLAAALRAFVDPHHYQHFFGPSILGLLISLLVSTVLEICSEGSTPIAADILNRAHAPGNAFAFLMAGVATNYSAIMVMRDTTKSWKIALFLPLISVPQILIVAWLVNLLS